MTLRSHLRVRPWNPKFSWCSTVAAAADAINRPHEDYPRRVAATAREVERLSRSPLPPTITGEMIRQIHSAVFADADFAGRWKERDIFLGVGGHPRVTLVADLMARLEDEYRGKMTSVHELREWHIDFETVHPFPDGNGRTGGIIVAAYSHRLHPERGWLAHTR